MKNDKKAAVAAADPDLDNIDKIRDILFGAKARDFETRFNELEKRLENELTALRRETDLNFNSLEEKMKEEFRLLGNRLSSEEESRNDSVADINSSLNSVSRTLEDHVAKINESSAETERSIRDLIREETKNLSSKLEKTQKELIESLDQESTEIRDNKADRAVLAELFTSMAKQLMGE